MRALERLHYGRGVTRLVGVDEAGRGPLAGPVVAAACHIPIDCHIDGIDDSKSLTATQRRRLFELLLSHPSVTYGIGVVPAVMIDRVNIYAATQLAMVEALRCLPFTPELALVDGKPFKNFPFPHVGIVGGDGLCYLIAAASIIAKEYRDRIMLQLDQQWPGYGFAAHKGYGTARHNAALAALGPSPVHRLTFAPCKAVKSAV